MHHTNTVRPLLTVGATLPKRRHFISATGRRRFFVVQLEQADHVQREKNPIHLR